MRPSLSILIDTYNHQKYIEQAVVSAIEQDFPASDYEIIVVDDGSTDCTPEIVKKFGPRVRLLEKKNGGQASAFNAAIPELRGEAVAFLDGDDWFGPAKVNTVLKALEREPHAAALGHGYHEVREGTGQTTTLSPGAARFLCLSRPDDARRACLSWPFFLTSALTVRRNELDRLMPLSNKLVFCADSPISFGCMATGALVIPEPLCYYRVHSENLHSCSPDDMRAMQRRFEVKELMYMEVAATLRRLGVPRECVRALLYDAWVQDSRSGLRHFGGARLATFRTELRAFQVEHQNPTAPYTLFKWLVVGGASLLLPPKLFYKGRDYYGRRNLGQLRAVACKADRDRFREGADG